MSTAVVACRDALAVLVDEPGQHSAEDLRRARSHASVCLRCSGALDDPDASRRVLAALAGRRPDTPMLLRVLLVVLATAQFIVASPWLFGASLVPDQHVAIAHLTRDGALGLTIATAGLLVAWRPRYALVATIVGAIVFTVQFATGLVDKQSQYVNVVFELTHVLVFAILGLVALATSAGRRSTPDTARHPQALRSL